MSDEQIKEATEETSDQPAAKKQNDPEPGDWMLRSLVTSVNYSEDMSFGITVCIGGTTISGDLISAKKYFAEMAIVSTRPVGAEVKADNIFAIWGAQLQKRIDEKTPVQQPEYLHLSDARIWSPSGSLPSDKGTLFRVRITSIGAFTLASLKTPEK